MSELPMLSDSTQADPTISGGEPVVSASSFLHAKTVRGEKPFRLILCTILCLGAIACKFFCPKGSALLRRWIVGAGDEQVQIAVSSFDNALQHGQNMEDAIAAFYQEITADDPT